MTDRGIDYGLGQTNVDRETGIRFGVIHTNHLFEWFHEQVEYDYGDPYCPKCGNEVQDTENIEIPEGTHPEERTLHRDYYCDSCDEYFWSEACYSDSPVCQYIDDGEYKAIVDEMGDVFIEKAPYFTRAQFCSPCAPGACYLTNPTPDGDMAYCFGHDWFEGDKAPYPVYCVKTGKEVLPKGINQLTPNPVTYRDIETKEVE